MKKILALLLIFVLLFSTACSKSDTGNTCNIKKETNSISSKAVNSTKQDESETNSKENEVNDKIDYTAYNEILSAYEKAYNFEKIDTMDEDYNYITGVNYIDLIDLNNDGILEFLISRVDTHEILHMDATTDPSTKPMVQIFTLDSNNEAVKITESTLVNYGDSGGKYCIEFAEVDGKTYLVTGSVPHSLNNRMKCFLTFDNIENGFVEGAQFAEIYDGNEYNTFYNDGNDVTKEVYQKKYDKWNSNLTQYTLIGCNNKELKVLQEKNKKTKEFLATFDNEQPMLGSTSIFYNDRFVIYERINKSEETQIVKQYFDALIYSDYETLDDIVAENSVDYLNWEYIKSEDEDGYFFPGYIVHSTEILQPEEYGYDTIHLSEDMQILIDEFGLVEHYIVKCNVREVEDFSVTTFAPQIGYGEFTYWFVMGKQNEQEEFELYDVINNKFYWNVLTHDPFEVAFLGYYNDLIKEEMIEGAQDLYPHSLYNYLDEEEVNNLQLYGYGGDEYYLVKNTWHSEMNVYKTIMGANGQLQRGEHLSTIPADQTFYFSCNLSEAYPEIEIVFTSPSNKEYSYYPYVDLMNNSVYLGNYAKHMEWLN